MSLTPPQAKVLGWINNDQWYSGSGYVVFAGPDKQSAHPSMVACNVSGNPFKYEKPEHLVVLKLNGPLAGSTDQVAMHPDQAEELATRLQELAARARQLRRNDGK